MRLKVQESGRATGGKLPHPELYCLRFWAFLLVFVHHFAGRYSKSIVQLVHDPLASRLLAAVLDLGSLGMDLFFCLSSFLITGMLVREYEQHGGLNIAAFLARRALRIFPLYFGFLGLTVIAIPYLLPGEHLSRDYLIPFLFFGANWACVFSGFPASVAAPLWSISGEQQFYLVWPALIAWLTPRRIVPLALVCFAVATIARLAVLKAGLPAPAIWANTLAHLDPIAAGALCSCMVRRNNWRIGRGSRGLLLALAVTLPLALLFTIGPSAYHGPWSLLFYPASAAACACVLAALYRPGAVACAPSLVYLGQISYGLFVFHTLAIQLTQGATAFLPAPIGRLSKISLCAGDMLIAFGVTVVLAALSYRYFEQPFLRYKALFHAKKPSSATPDSGRGTASADSWEGIVADSRGVTAAIK